MSYLPKEPFPSWDQIDRDECLVIEELCRVIASARRFQTIEEAWKAILNTRKIAKQIKDETVHLHGESEVSGATARDAGEK